MTRIYSILLFSTTYRFDERTEAGVGAGVGGGGVVVSVVVEVTVVAFSSVVVGGALGFCVVVVVGASVVVGGEAVVTDGSLKGAQTVEVTFQKLKSPFNPWEVILSL